MKKEIISVDNVSFFYDKHLVLDSINLKIYENDFVIFLGPNGGGKSTLAKIILKCLKPQKGTVDYKSDNLTISYIPQNIYLHNLLPLKVIDVVLMGRLVKKRRKFFYNKEDKEKVLEILEELDIISLKDKYIDELSGGQKQRVFIARALAQDANVIILDEPTANVDPRNSNSIYQKLIELNKEATIILITHDLTALSIIPNSKIYFLNKKIKYIDSPIIKKEDLKEIYNCPIELIASGIPHRVGELYND